MKLCFTDGETELREPDVPKQSRLDAPVLQECRLIKQSTRKPPEM